MAQTHIQQHQISGSLVGDMSDSVARGDLIKSGRTIIDDLNSLRTQVKGILGSEAWTAEQAITLQNLKAQLTGSLVANSGSFAGDLGVTGEATLASAKISDLTNTRVVFAGADGALVDDAALSFASNALKIGASSQAGEIWVNNSSNARTLYLDGDGAGLYVGGPVDGTVGVKDSQNRVRMIADPSGITLRDSSETNRIILDGTSGGLYAYNGSGQLNAVVDGATGNATFEGNADINGALDVAGQVDLAASGVATSVRGTLNVAEEATLASAIVSDLTDTRVVFAGASGALVDDADFTYAAGQVSLGGTVNGLISLKNSSNQTHASLEAGQAELLLQYSSDGSQAILNPNALVAQINGTERVRLDFVQGMGVFGGPDSAGELGLKDTSGQYTMTFEGGIATATIGGPVAGVLNLKDASNAQTIAFNAATATATLGGPVGGLLSVKDASDVQTISLDGATGDATFEGNADINGTLDVAGQVDLAASGVATSVRGTLAVAELADFNGDVTANKISIDSDVAQRLYIVDADGSIKDEENMTFDGSTLAVTGAISGSGNFQIGGSLTAAGAVDLNGALDVAGQVDLAAAGVATSVRGTLAVAELADFNGDVTANKISIDGDVAQRLYIVGASGELKDESKLTFDGSEMAVDGDLAVTGNAAFAGNVQVDGDLRVKGSMTYIDTTNMRVQDAFIYLATGSLGSTDSGIVLHGGAGASMDLVLGQDGGAGEFILGKADRSPDGDGEMDGITLVPAWLSEAKLGSAEGALSGSMSIAGNDIKLAASAAAIVFDDAYRASSTYAAPIKLAASAAEWTAFQTQYPGKSLLGALGAGGGVGVNFRKKTIMGGNANFSGNTLDIAAAGIGTLRSTAQVDADYGLDVYLNGVLLALGASADYTVPSTTQISFNYALNSDDVLTIVAKNVA